MPVAAEDTIRELAQQVERVVCLLVPADLYAIGVWYEDFAQVPDDEVVRLLDLAWESAEERSTAYH